MPEGLQPATRSTSEELAIQNVRSAASDFGSYQHIRDVAGIIFLVDAADFQRFAKIKAELDSLLATKEIQAVPIVVLENKIDSLYAVSEEEVRYELGLECLHT
ncbi:ADP-ribosylation factor family-domain-containing protein [Nemania abortiva]|nr:ADP-ribosylation factor family-domain-containing protein [Nemania abortiva]